MTTPRKSSAPKAAKRTSGKRGPGRPNGCTPQVTATICEHIRGKLPAKEAARRSGISERTYHAWIAKADPEHAEHHERYVHFLHEVTCASLDREKNLIAKIDSADDWRAAGWLLERLHPERWSLKHLIEVTGAQGGPVQVAAQVNIGPVTDAQTLAHMHSDEACGAVPEGSTRLLATALRVELAAVTAELRSMEEARTMPAGTADRLAALLAD